MRKKHTANVQYNGTHYDASKAEDREALRELGFVVSDDGTSVGTPKGVSGKVVNVNTGTVKGNLIQTGNDDPDIRGGIEF